MKKMILIFSVAILFMAVDVVSAQEQPEPKKDTVNIDTDAKPTFYYAEEDEAAESKGNSAVVAIIAGVVVILAGGAFFLLKRKK